MCGASVGLMMGCIFDDDEIARQTTGFAFMFFMLGAGAFSNAKTFPWYMKAIETISPMRYANELYFRRITEGM